MKWKAKLFDDFDGDMCLSSSRSTWCCASFENGRVMASKVTTRKSSKMDMIYTALTQEGGFVSAQELYRKLNDKGERIGLATVYRNLQHLIDLGTVVATRSDDSEVIYSACEDDSHHHHLRCKSCGSSVKIDNEEAERWAAEVAREFGFTEVSHTFDIVGLCSTCQRSRR